MTDAGQAAAPIVWLWIAGIFLWAFLPWPTMKTKAIRLAHRIVDRVRDSERPKIDTSWTPSVATGLRGDYEMNHVPRTQIAKNFQLVQSMSSSEFRRAFDVEVDQ